MDPVDRWTFGVEPLPQTEQAAARLRRVTDLLLGLEAEEPAVDRLIADLERAETDLAAVAPTDTTPRVGEAASGNGRAYIDHARHVGAFNPAFPTYEITVDGPRAHGTVTFPLVFEGPPGLVHGGFLGVFFDLVVQHHNCDVGVAGKTTAMTVRYRRPTPLGVPLDFTIDRTVVTGPDSSTVGPSAVEPSSVDSSAVNSSAVAPSGAGRIRSQAVITRDGKVLCEADVDAIAGVRANLPVVSPRRVDGPAGEGS